jgi:hypothetical protein
VSIGSRDRASSPATLSALSTLPSEQFEGIEEPISRPQSALLRRRRGTTKVKLQTSWIYNHILDKDRETQYINIATRKPKWRYKYYPKTFKLSGGTSIITDYLLFAEAEGGHNIPYLSPRDIQV